MKVVAVSNQKGGVGKTVIAVHFAYYLAELGYKVLVVDFDPQGNASDSLFESAMITDLKSSRLFYNSVEPVLVEKGIALISADNYMVDVDRGEPNLLTSLQSNIDKYDSEFDYCIIDTPATLGLLMSAALLVSDYVFSPIELEEYSIKGISMMLETIYGVKRSWNPALNFLGMLPNRYNIRSESQFLTLNNLISNYQELVINAPVGLRTSIPSALSEGKPVWQLRKTSARPAGKELKKAFDIIHGKMKGEN